MLRETIAISSGLTTATTAYSLGDQMGGLLQWDLATELRGCSGIILGLTAIDESAVLGAFDLFLFNAAVTPAADNAAATFSAADIRKAIGLFNFQAANLSTVGGGTVGYVLPVSGGGPFRLDDLGTSLYGCMVARSANPVFAAGANSVRIKINLQYQ